MVHGIWSGEQKHISSGTVFLPSFQIPATSVKVFACAIKFALIQATGIVERHRTKQQLNRTLLDIELNSNRSRLRARTSQRTD